MFGLSFVEVIAIGVILLIVVGPKQLPEVARTIAKFLNEFKRTTSEFTDSFYNIRTDITKSVDQAREKLSKEAGLSEIKQGLGSVEREINQDSQSSTKSSDHPDASGAEEQGSTEGAAMDSDEGGSTS